MRRDRGRCAGRGDGRTARPYSSPPLEGVWGVTEGGPMSCCPFTLGRLYTVSSVGSCQGGEGAARGGGGLGRGDDEKLLNIYVHMYIHPTDVPTGMCMHMYASTHINIYRYDSGRVSSWSLALPFPVADFCGMFPRGESRSGPEQPGIP